MSIRRFGIRFESTLRMGLRKLLAGLNYGDLLLGCGRLAGAGGPDTSEGMSSLRRIGRWATQIGSAMFASACRKVGIGRRHRRSRGARLRQPR